jgi:hypothetical protein
MTSRARIRAVRDALGPLAPRGVLVVPAFDEAELLPRFLASLAAVEAPPGVVVLIHANNCRDATADVARGFRARLGGLGPVVVESRYEPPNVGLVRAESAQGAIEAGCAWLHFLDADGTLPDADFVAEAARLAEAGADGCWSGCQDEFADVREQLRGHLPASLEADVCDAVLGFGSAFRCRALPRALPLVRYTDGSNSLVRADAYVACGGFEPKRVGGDSTLGDRYLAQCGRLPGFFDRPVATSNRKPLASGRLGGFVFYPARESALPSVRRAAGVAGLGPITVARCFDAVCDDLRSFLLFTLYKRRAHLEAAGAAPERLAAGVAEAFEAERRHGGAALELDASGSFLRLSRREDRLERTIELSFDAAERFWETG